MMEGFNIFIQDNDHQLFKYDQRLEAVQKLPMALLTKNDTYVHDSTICTGLYKIADHLPMPCIALKET